MVTPLTSGYVAVGPNGSNSESWFPVPDATNPSKQRAFRVQSAVAQFAETNGTSITKTTSPRAILDHLTDVATLKLVPERATRSKQNAVVNLEFGELTTVVAAVIRDLADIARTSPELASSTLAATALALAREMDDAGRDKPNSATSKAMCANSLREVMDRLRELMPAEEEADALDDLAARGNASVPSGE